MSSTARVDRRSHLLRCYRSSRAAQALTERERHDDDEVRLRSTEARIRRHLSIKRSNGRVVQHLAAKFWAVHTFNRAETITDRGKTVFATVEDALRTWVRGPRWRRAHAAFNAVRDFPLVLRNIATYATLCSVTRSHISEEADNG